MANSEPVAAADQLALLADAISDVGYWSWWTHELPEVFQVEFGGTQLYFPPLGANKPPQTQIALQFQQPTSISFLSRGAGNGDFTWVQQLHDDQLESPGCSYGEFSFGDEAALFALLHAATQVNTIQGHAPTTEAFLREPYRLVFWCGDYGFAISARNLRLVTHSRSVALDKVAEVNRQWWDYWRRYWAHKDTTDPLLHDYACEVTIPLKS
jgi:hypothetical protein